MNVFEIQEKLPILFFFAASELLNLKLFMMSGLLSAEIICKGPQNH